MNTKTTITFKTDKKLRDAAKHTAMRLGIPLSTILNAYLEEFVETQTFCVSLHPRGKLAQIFSERKQIVISTH